jgi:enoyl-CoA hydratase/carnithine racemase
MSLESFVKKFQNDLTTLSLKAMNDVLVISFNRPEKLNAISSDMQNEIIELFEFLKKEQFANALVLTGEGRAFMAGADISEYGRDNVNDFVDFQKNGQKMYDAIRNSDFVVIAAVNGYALGGGLEMALATDIIFAASDAKFGLPEIKLGLLPGGGATNYLQAALSEQSLKYLLISGKSISAQESLRLGIIQEVHENENLISASVELAVKINTYSREATSKAKFFLNSGYHADLDARLKQEHQNLISLFDSDNGQEGISAFLEKRPAKFKFGGNFE